MLAICVPDPNPTRAGNIEISLAVNFYAVWNTVFLATWFFPKNAAVRQRSIRLKIVHPNVALLAVVNVELLAIGRKGQPVGLRQLFGQQRDFSIGIQAEDSLKGKLLFFSRYQVKRWIGEIQSTAGTKHYVIRTVQFLAFEAIGKNCVLAFGSYSDYRAQHAGAIDQAVLLVVGVAVWIAKRDDFGSLAIQRHLINLVHFFVADVEKSSGVPDRTFREAEALGDDC